jgi:uncharacterized protein involved in outer membrane biogenesis
MNSSLARWLPRLRVAAIALAAALVVFGVVGVFAIPQLVRWGIETVATRELGRTVRVETIRANPFTLGVTLRNLTVDGAPGEPQPLLTVREVHANGSAGSIFRRAPVLDALRIDGLTANVVRLEAQRFNFSDIVERLRARPKTSDEQARFSISNIEVAAGTVNFDDRPAGRRHTVTDLAVGIPFVSSLPVHADITVQPSLSAKLDGAPVAIEGETRPFKQTLESSVRVKLDAIDIPTYLAYSPVPLNFSVPRGTLAADLTIALRRAAPAQGAEPAVEAQTLISGGLTVSNFALAAPAAQPQPLIEWNALRVVLDEVEPFARRAVIGDAALAAPKIDVARDGSGSINWLRFLAAPLGKTPGASPPPATAAEPFRVTLKQASVRDGTLSLADDSAGRFRLQWVNLQADVAGITNTSATRGRVQARADVAQQGGSVAVDGEVGLAPAVAGTLKVSARDVRMLAPARYLASVVDATIDGSSDVDALLDFALAPETAVVVRDIRWAGKDIKVRGPAGTGAEFDLAGVTMEESAIDLLRRQVVIGKLALDAPRATVRRMADGRINWLAAFRAPPGDAAPRAGPAAESKPWTVALKEGKVSRGELRLEDLAVQPAVRLRATQIGGTVRNVTSDGRQRAEFDLATRFGATGALSAQGGAKWSPLAADARVNARNLDVSALRPYIAERLNATLASAEVSGRGTVTAARPAADAPLAVSYRGGARVGNLHLLDAEGENDLLKWQLLDLEQINVAAGRGPPRVEVGKATLSDFFARVILSAEGELNLVQVLRRDGAPPSAAPAPTGPSEPPTTPRATAATAPLADREMAGNSAPAPRAAAKPAAAPATPAADRPLIRIGQIDIVRGNVNFTDDFIKPNYTANMTGLTGSVTTLASDSAEPATLKLAGMIDNEAPVSIDGRLNPLAPVLFLDIEGRTKGVDLPRLTPYSIKYAGYPIVKGKLSMDVKYKIEDGKLAANNHLFVDQLTFGEKVESPTATKLPVLLAVRLLTNNKGEIDLNLPISGTLSDPKFSMGGLIVQVIVNLLTKVVTAPFSLLASAFGGGEELGFVEFAPGSAALDDTDRQRLATLAKALNERGGLRLDIIGRVDPALDAEGVKRAKLDARLRAAKVRQVVRASGESLDPASVTITAEERGALMASVYSAESIPNKPRNAIGIARSIPPAEMEALIVANLAVTPEDLRALASQRAAAVRNHLESDGKVSRERLFLVEPKVTADGIADKGATTRVDFSLK